MHRTALETGQAPLSPAPPVPDLFIVGHKKSGTTALHQMLGQHPQIFMPSLKEPHYFAKDRRARFENPRGQELPATLEEYLRLFEPAAPDQRIGEASASYLWSHEAAREIHEVAPQARVIAILREPANFLRSEHLQFMRIHFEDRKDLREALASEGARREGRGVPRGCPYPEMLFYSDHVTYVEQLRRYHALFPAERVLVLIYEDFRADNEATVRRIMRFLEVDDERPIGAVDANTTTRTMRSQTLDDMVYSVTLGRGRPARAARTLLKALTPPGARHDAMQTLRRRVIYSEAPEPDETLMLELRQRFKPEVVALSEYLGRDLVGLWGYDRIA